MWQNMLSKIGTAVVITVMDSVFEIGVTSGRYVNYNLGFWLQLLYLNVYQSNWRKLVVWLIIKFEVPFLTS